MTGLQRLQGRRCLLFSMVCLFNTRATRSFEPSALHNTRREYSMTAVKTSKLAVINCFVYCLWKKRKLQYSSAWENNTKIPLYEGGNAGSKPKLVSPYHPSIHIWRYSPFRALTSLIRRLHSSLFSALLLHPLIPSSCNASLWIRLG